MVLPEFAWIAEKTTGLARASYSTKNILAPYGKALFLSGKGLIQTLTASFFLGIGEWAEAQKQKSHSLLIGLH